MKLKNLALFTALVATSAATTGCGQSHDHLDPNGSLGKSDFPQPESDYSEKPNAVELDKILGVDINTRDRGAHHGQHRINNGDYVLHLQDDAKGKPTKFTYKAGEELFITVVEDEVEVRSQLGGWAFVETVADGITIYAGDTYDEITATLRVIREDQARILLESHEVIGNHTANYAAEQTQAVSPSR